MSMETVTSTDGQEIAYWRSGTGPPVLLVHGALSDRSAWILLHPILEKRFTVYSMNRRGREGSGVPAPHTAEREFEDVVAVVEAVGGPVHLVGHSGGALCSLGAVLLTDRVRSLTLYEPPFIEVSRRNDFDFILSLIDQGKHEEAAIEFLGAVVQTPKADLDRLRASPIWPHIVSLAPTMPPEFDALSNFQFDASLYRNLDVPMLLLVGSESQQPLTAVNQALRDAVLNARYVELPGQQHGANLAAPEMFATEVVKFIDDVEGNAAKEQHA
jgi:pimeloyl-ACP methyl ester carboxylesterase